MLGSRISGVFDPSFRSVLKTEPHSKRRYLVIQMHPGTTLQRPVQNIRVCFKLIHSAWILFAIVIFLVHELCLQFLKPCNSRELRAVQRQERNAECGSVCSVGKSRLNLILFFPTSIRLSDQLTYYVTKKTQSCEPQGSNKLSCCVPNSRTSLTWQCYSVSLISQFALPEYLT